MNKNTKIQRKARTRSHITVTKDRPRLSVFRSNRYSYAQIITIDGQTVVGVSEKKVAEKGTPIEKARIVGKMLAELALAKKVKHVVFDKGSFAYHGRVKALAEGAREGGLQF